MFLSCQVRVWGWIHTLCCLNVKKLLAQNRNNIWSSSDCNGTQTRIHLVRKRTLNHLANLTKSLSWVLNTYLYGAFDCMFLSCNVRGSEWINTLCCLNVKNLFAQNRWDIWNLSDWNRIRTHNHLFRKQTRNHFAKLTKWLSWILSTYLYCAFDSIDSMFSSCHVRVS